MPQEVHLFPKERVFPLFGGGEPFKVEAYQLGVARCPNYTEDSLGLGGCGVYESRPRACRAYPVIASTASVVVAQPDARCPGVRALPQVSGKFFSSEMAAYTQRLIDELHQGDQIQWMWPLNKQEWVPVR